MNHASIFLKLPSYPFCSEFPDWMTDDGFQLFRCGSSEIRQIDLMVKTSVFHIIDITVFRNEIHRGYIHNSGFLFGM